MVAMVECYLLLCRYPNGVEMKVLTKMQAIVIRVRMLVPCYWDLNPGSTDSVCGPKQYT